MSNSSIWPIDMILLDATTPGQSGPESDGNEEVLHIPQSSSFTGASSSDLVSYPGQLLRESYSFVEMQLVYSTAPVTGSFYFLKKKKKKKKHFTYKGCSLSHSNSPIFGTSRKKKGTPFPQK